MDKRLSPGTTAEEEYQTAETAKYYTPHFKAGGLTGIISPEAAEFIVGDDDNVLGAGKYAIGGFQVSMEQMLRLTQMHEKVISDFNGKIEMLYMQSKKSLKYGLYWSEQVQSLF